MCRVALAAKSRSSCLECQDGAISGGRLVECIVYLWWDKMCTSSCLFFHLMPTSASTQNVLLYQCLWFATGRQSNELAARLAGRERAKWRHIGAGIVLPHYTAGWLMRKFCHRGLSVKNKTTARDGRQQEKLI